MTPLTAKEKEVLQRLADGDTTIVIAKQMFVSQSTVKFYRREILKKLGVHTTANAVADGIRKEIIE
jgi:DNA-binding NarL/FixJ family response regulator